VVLALAAAGLAACGGSSGPPTLTWYINPDAGGQAENAKRCTQDAGGAYSITTSLLPREASAQREQLVRRLAANDDSIDLMSLDPPFVPELAEARFIEPVPSDIAKKVTDNVVESAVRGSTWKGKLVAVPFWANTQLLWYKKSVAQKAGLDPATEPVTWDELIKAAEEQHTLIAVQGIRAEALTVWINALVESAGGHILENPEAPADQVKLGIDSQAGKDAATVIRTIADHDLAGPAFSTENEDASRALFESGDASFMVNWPFVWPAANDAVKAGTLNDSVVKDYGWALYPRMQADEQSRPPYGGINIGVGAFSRHKDMAFQAVQCIVSEQNQAYYFVSNGNPPANKAAFADKAVTDAFPMAPVIAESLDAAAPRPQTPYYNEVSQGLQRTWHPPRSVNPDTTPQRSAALITAVLRKERLL
jgi:multiple sugar transport system substrate-binding protein